MTCMGNKPRDVYRSGEVTPRRVYNFCRGEKKKNSSVVAVQKGSSVSPDKDASVFVAG